VWNRYWTDLGVKAFPAKGQKRERTNSQDAIGSNRHRGKKGVKKMGNVLAEDQHKGELMLLT